MNEQARVCVCVCVRSINRCVSCACSRLVQGCSRCGDPRLLPQCQQMTSRTGADSDGWEACNHCLLYPGYKPKNHGLRVEGACRLPERIQVWAAVSANGLYRNFGDSQKEPLRFGQAVGDSIIFVMPASPASSAGTVMVSTSL